MFTKTKLVIIGLALLALACTPKVAQEIQQPEAEPEETVQQTIEAEPTESLSPCPKFSDAPDPDEASTNYVLYRDFLKAGEWNQAFDYWKKVYAVAPAADGKRNSVYADGITFYEYFISQTDDESKKQDYINEIFNLYDQIDECYQEGGFIAGRKAFDYYYKYPNLKTREEIFQLFKKSIDTDGEETNDFVVNPFTSLLVELHFDDKISVDEAKHYEQQIRKIIDYGLENCEGRGCERWKVVQGYAPARLEAFETVKGFYDCEYYMNKYYGDFEANPQDCEMLITVFSRLKWGGCLENDERFRKLIQAGNQNCVEESELELAYDALRSGKYDEAIELFEKAVQEEEDNTKKAEYTLLIAKIYNAHLKNFSRARQYARKALEYNSNWGEPYILIGRLYASSGPLCGPGRGWDSQIVVWPAIDKWQQAKRVDPSVAAEANKWINRYSQYMPNKEDVFIRNLKVGSSFKVGCWIQETTTIRTAD